MTDPHRDSIVDQFTRQATPFADAPAIKDEAHLRMVVDFSGAGVDDTVLDVACGPGLLACAFARVARHVTGIDITPAMLDRARVLQRELGLTELTWQQGDVVPLPYPDRAFTIVVSRLGFHHFLDPRAVLAEMKRVCAPGGTVVVVDIAPPRDKADAFNQMDKLRDPSHVRAMTRDEHLRLFADVGLPSPRETVYELEGELEALLARSFPKPGDDVKIRRIFDSSLERDDLGINARRVGARIQYAFPIVVLAAQNV